MLRYEALDLKGVKIDFSEESDQSESGSYLDDCLEKLLSAEKKSTIDLKTLLLQYEDELLVKIADCLSNSDEDIVNKRKAILILTMLGSQAAVEVLINALSSSHDHSIRFNIIQALNRIKARYEGRVFSPIIIKKEVLRELRNYKSIQLLFGEYRARKSIDDVKQDFLAATFHAIREESLERIFRLLGLLYDSELVHVIYDRLPEAKQDKNMKANVLELLQNVADPDIYKELRVIVDKKKEKQISDEIIEHVISNFVEGHDLWLTICAMLLIVELNLTHLRPLIERMTSAQMSIVRQTAEIALIKLELQNGERK